MLDGKKEEYSRIEREYDELFDRFKRIKDEQFFNKIAEAEKKSKEDYLLRLKTLQDKYSKEEEIIHLENQKLSSGHHEQQGLEMLQKVGDNLDWKIGALRKEI